MKCFGITTIVTKVSKLPKILQQVQVHLFSSMSDSDSSLSSSSSWVFVDETNTNTDSPNRFYLNCSKEPVQELTEGDLGVLRSDVDSDSDGISVITDPDDYVQNYSSDELSVKNDNEGDTENIDSQNVVQKPPRQDVAQTINFWKIVISSSLIGAGIMVVAILITPYISSKSENELNKSCFAESERETISISAVLGSKTDGSHFHCDKKHGRFSKACEERKHGKHHKLKENNASNERSKRDRRVVKGNYNFDYIQEKNKSREKQYAIQNSCFKSCEDEIKKKIKKLNAKETFLTKKEGYLIKKEYDLKKMELEIQKRLGNLRHTARDEGKKKVKYDFKKDKKHNLKNSTNNGFWQMNLHRAREELRKKEHASDWLFDRATYRSKQRDHAHWHFQRMLAREQKRFKQDSRKS